MIFVDGAFRRRAQMHHENAYAAGSGLYKCAWGDRPTILAVNRSSAFYRDLPLADHAALRARQRDWHREHGSRYDDA